MKAIQMFCSADQLGTFPPGHFYTPETGFVRYYEPLWRRPSIIPSVQLDGAAGDEDLAALRNCLEQATQKRLISDAPLGMVGVF